MPPSRCLRFMTEYETSIQHSPIALEHHRKELKRDPYYEGFLHRCFFDPHPQTRPQDPALPTITRRSRFRLLLEQIIKVTKVDHPDMEEILLVLSVLGDLIKSTQPGIEVEESKVKFWDISESLVYSKGQIIDMDLYDDSRTLIHAGPVARKVGNS